jgi:hypothetical protein
MKMSVGRLRAVIRQILEDKSWVGQVGGPSPEDQQWLIQDLRDLNDKEKQEFLSAGWRKAEGEAPATKAKKAILYHPQHWTSTGATGETLFGLQPKTDQAKEEYASQLRYYKNLTKQYEKN